MLIERSHSQDVTGRVAAILRRMYRLGKSSGSHAFKDASSNAEIRQRGAAAKADHLCIDLLSQLAAEQ